MTHPQNSSTAEQDCMRPDIIEKLTYHRHERDDMTLDDCLEYLANRWKKIHRRPERALIMQITELLASKPEPEWIDDPHDIEQGMMRNPKYRAAQPTAAIDTSHGLDAAIKSRIAHHEAKLDDDNDFHKSCSGNIVSELRNILNSTAAIDVREGIEKAAQFLDTKREDFMNENGGTDPETGAWESSSKGEDYVNLLYELAEDIRALKSAPSAQAAEVEK